MITTLDEAAPALESEQATAGPLFLPAVTESLLPLTKKIAGDERPKQFCAIVGGETLLAETRRRVSAITSPGQTLIVVTKRHERYYADTFAGVPSHTRAAL